MSHDKQSKRDEADLSSEIARALNREDKLPRALLLALLGVTVVSTLYAVKLRFDLDRQPLSAPKGKGVSAVVVQDSSALQEAVLPSHGVALPVRWGDLGKKLVENGTIDIDKFNALYATQGGLTPDQQALLVNTDNGQIVINRNNSAMLLNLFWGLGLANKNEILEKGPMVDPRYGGANKFASTGGWTISKGDAMKHYSKHAMFSLTPEQQTLVEKMGLSIYRPCCDNATIFPDCNHGMAMLGLLELMASQGATEKEMWDAALATNSYWFPENYMTMATYFKENGRDWKSIAPDEILSKQYSSASGYRALSAKVTNPVSAPSSGGGCSVSLAPTIANKRIAYVSR